MGIQCSPYIPVIYILITNTSKYVIYVPGPSRRRNLSAVAMEIFETHQGTHILQVAKVFITMIHEYRSITTNDVADIVPGFSSTKRP